MYGRRASDARLSPPLRFGLGRRFVGFLPMKSLDAARQSVYLTSRFN
jgi:hypothetical protein